MINLILKLTNACNLRCKYCSLGKKENFIFMDKEKLIQAMDFIADIAENKGEKEISVIFHGGEPSLLNPNIYREAIKHSLKYSNLTFQWKMQSNGYCFSEDFIKFLSDKDISVGISVDGSKKNHDANRINENGEETYDKVIDNIIKLKANNIKCSALMVVNKMHLTENLDFLEWFSQNNVPLKINPIIDCGEASGENSLLLDSGEYAKYLIRIFKYVLEKDMQITVQPIEDMLKCTLGLDLMRECSFSEKCFERFLCIDYLGDVYPCGRFSDMQKFKLGNIGAKDYNIYVSNSFRSLERLNLRIVEKCDNCNYMEKCGGGCTAVRALRADTKNPLCEDYKMLIDFFKNEGIKLYKKYLIEKKEELTTRLDNLRKMNGI